MAKLLPKLQKKKQKQTTSSAPDPPAAATRKTGRCRGYLLPVCTHLLVGMVVFVASQCYQWRDMLPQAQQVAQNLVVRGGSNNGTVGEGRAAERELDLAPTPATLPPGPLFANGTVKHVYWMHIPKTGSSFFNTIFFRFCPGVLDREREKAALQGKTIIKANMDSKPLITNFPPDQWCDVDIYNMPMPGMHHPYKDRPSEVFYTMTMFRHPVERLWSAFRFGWHGTLKKKPWNATFPEFVREFNIPNCQLKMVLGYDCHGPKKPAEFERISPLDVDLAVERVSGKRFFFGITERWEESICLFHKWFGGEIIPDVEFFNNRKGAVKKEPEDYHNEVPIHEEMAFYEAILPVFEERLKAAGCLGYDGSKEPIIDL